MTSWRHYWCHNARIGYLWGPSRHTIQETIMLKDRIIRITTRRRVYTSPLPVVLRANPQPLVVLCFCRTRKCILGLESQWNRNFACKLSWGTWLDELQGKNSERVQAPQDPQSQRLCNANFVQKCEFRFSSKTHLFSLWASPIETAGLLMRDRWYFYNKSE